MADKISAATKALVDALIALIVLLIESNHAKSAGSVGTPEPAKQEGPEWPKNFSTFYKAWKKTSPKAEGFIGAVFEKVSCNVWTPEAIRMVVLGDAQFEANATSKEALDVIAAELKAQLGFTGELFITAGGMAGSGGGDTAGKSGGRGKSAGKSAAEAKPEKAAEAVTVAMVQNACVELAKRTGKPETPREVLKKFGAGKVGELPAEKLPEVLEALKNYGETASTGAAADEF